MIINKREKPKLEIGYKNSSGDVTYYADKDARRELKNLSEAILNIAQGNSDINISVESVKDDIKNIYKEIDKLSLTGGVPKQLNTLTNEVKSEQISMNGDVKEMYLYIDNNSKPSKVSVEELGRIHNKLTPLVRTVDDTEELQKVSEGEYVFNNIEKGE